MTPMHDPTAPPVFLSTPRGAGRRSDGVRAAAYFQRLMRGPLGLPGAEAAPPEPTPDAIGPWRVLGVAGRGGMGTVYRVEQPGGGGPAAVKLAVRSACGRPAAQLLHERDVLAEITHPAVVRLRGSGEAADGRPYIVLDLVEGVPVTTWAHALRLRDRLATFRAVCEAVAAVHARGIVHCDLKPSNVLVGAGGRVTLLDFGIARRAGDMPDAAEGPDPMLTPEFAAPEQVMGRRVTRATDVYTLGLLLHELLCGRRHRVPWGLAGGGSTPVECVPTRFAAGEWGLAAPAVATFGGATPQRAALDQRVQAMLQTALRCDPALRYPSAAHLARAADALLDADRAEPSLPPPAVCPSEPCASS
jgi:serine/threonine protein kinase